MSPLKVRLAHTLLHLESKNSRNSDKDREFRAMKTRTVTAIILPYQNGVPLHPSVTTGERITRAIELMVKFNVKCIAVTRGARPIGVIRLTDAFQELGLKASQK
jgi:arginine/lysine/ornithine decarboxylase